MAWNHRKTLCSAPTVAVLALMLSACGGGSKSSTTTTKSTTTATHKTQSHAALPLESVRIGTSQTYATAATASPADAVSFRTVLPAGSKGSPVLIKITAGPAKALTVTATAGQSSGTATVRSANGTQLTLLEPHYSCTLPPVPSFCPAKSVTKTAHGYTLQFNPRATSTIQVSALVGPVTLPKPKVTAAGKSVVPPYTVTELLRVRNPGSSASSSSIPAAPTVSAKPGQLVVMYSEVKSGVHGAKQPVTVTLNQGPGKSLTITAAAKGGPSSTATVKSASGSPIALVLPHYTCYVTPTPTFCPASSIKTAPHRYILTFEAAPGTATIELQALVQA